MPGIAIAIGSLEADLFSSTGDSGARALRQLGNNEVAAVGILRGSPEGDDGYTEFALLAPILATTNATAICLDSTWWRPLVH
ncbi:membrane protein [Mycobacteroides abscessus subsp. bolletii]|nr:membrane protein [Mycobacteroides abscessus subsp. bolletii]SKP62318.1 membrane protein [Mycobacteroides abscessus subsp. bolletii]SKP73507.1 membrane protein [Mycobacteroides abscessus subsp. bolletii]SKQ21321.1 membrane protein [Mycobacteroides abscessus subsp. bolletii]